MVTINSQPQALEKGSRSIKYIIKFPVSFLSIILYQTAELGTSMGYAAASHEYLSLRILLIQPVVQ